MALARGGVVGQRRWYYPALAAPGIIWLILLFVLPFYAIAAVAFGTRDQIFALPIPAWNPLEWQFETFTSTASEFLRSGGVQTQFIRTIVYVVISVSIPSRLRRPGTIDMRSSVSVSATGVRSPGERMKSA